MRVVFLGSGEIGIPSLRALAASNRHDLCAVFTQPDRPAGRELKLRAPLVKLAALSWASALSSRRESGLCSRFMLVVKPDIIVGGVRAILSREVFSMPPFGSINIHASLLPRHRGASPIQAAILSGDTETGVTIMQVDAGLDTGDVLLKVVTPIASNETSGSLHDRLAQLAPEALLACLEDFERGRVSPQKQDNAFASYAPKLTRADGEIDVNCRKSSEGCAR
jgi:methionyl-tRNA formyltransferase